jgi:Protein of unknown function (DUF3892)
MSAFQVVCVETKEPHEGIIAVGTSSDGVRADRRWTVSAVRQAIEAGDRFFTVSPSTEDEADVEPYGDGIRTDPDEVTDNNLDDLRACRFEESR